MALTSDLELSNSQPAKETEKRCTVTIYCHCCLRDTFLFLHGIGSTHFKVIKSCCLDNALVRRINERRMHDLACCFFFFGGGEILLGRRPVATLEHIQAKCRTGILGGNKRGSPLHISESVQIIDARSQHIAPAKRLRL